MRNLPSYRLVHSGCIIPPCWPCSGLSNPYPPWFLGDSHDAFWLDRAGWLSVGCVPCIGPGWCSRPGGCRRLWVRPTIYAWSIHGSLQGTNSRLNSCERGCRNPNPSFHVSGTALVAATFVDENRLPVAAIRMLLFAFLAQTTSFPAWRDPGTNLIIWNDDLFVNDFVNDDCFHFWHRYLVAVTVVQSCWRSDGGRYSRAGS